MGDFSIQHSKLPHFKDLWDRFVAQLKKNFKKKVHFHILKHSGDGIKGAMICLSVRNV